MTTAPVTAGGRIRWIRSAPAKWISTPTAASTRPPTRIAPVTYDESLPVSSIRMAATEATKDALVPR